VRNYNLIRSAHTPSDPSHNPTAIDLLLTDEKSHRHIKHLLHYCIQWIILWPI